MSSSRLVYSTDGSNSCERCGKALHKCRCERDAQSAPQGDGIVRLRLERKGRAGKEVTVIEGLQLPTGELKTLVKRLKSACGTGGGIKQTQVEIQGDRREQLHSLLSEAGFQVKLSGG